MTGCREAAVRADLAPAMPAEPAHVEGCAFAARACGVKGQLQEQWKAATELETMLVLC